MGKFSQAGSTGGGMSALERLAAKAQADLPAGPREEVAPCLLYTSDAADE